MNVAPAAFGAGFPGHAHPHAPTLGGGEQIPRRKPFVVNEWERMVLVHEGSVLDVLGAGAHRRAERDLVGWRVDMRPWVLHVPTQEVPTADGVTVKVTVAAQARVVDPLAFVTATRAAAEAVYLFVQVAIREVLAATSLDDLLAARVEVRDRLVSAVGDLSATGIALDRLELKDVVLPGELKRAQAQVLLARAEGLAALERARGETAALRGLANAARLVTEQPALLELRLIQELGQSSGHTVVLGTRPSAGLT